MGTPKLRTTPTSTPSKPPRSKPIEPLKSPRRGSFFTHIASLFRAKKPVTPDWDSDLYQGDVKIDEEISSAPMRLLSPRSTECMPTTPQARKTRTISFGISPKRERKGGNLKDGGAKSNAVASAGMGKSMIQGAGVGAGVPATDGVGDGGDVAVGQVHAESPAVALLRRQSQPSISRTPASPGKDAALGSHPVAGAEGSDSLNGRVYATPISEMSSGKGRPVTM